MRLDHNNKPLDINQPGDDPTRKISDIGGEIEGFIWENMIRKAKDAGITKEDFMEALAVATKWASQDWDDYDYDW